MLTVDCGSPPLNAGLRLWQAQKAQGTNLCVGLDPHYDEKAGLGEEFYARYEIVTDEIETIIDSGLDMWVAADRLKRTWNGNRIRRFLRGVYGYYAGIIDTAWGEGVRVFKPQSAFFERLQPWGPALLLFCVTSIRQLAQIDEQPCFITDDVKRGDIADTQRPYYEVYLAPPEYEVFPGMGGAFDFDTMTVTTWMGQDVLTPGLDFFRMGKGAVVVTKSSNPSGTTLQDLEVETNEQVELTDKQAKFKLTPTEFTDLSYQVDGRPTAYEAMLFLTEKFSRSNQLNQNGISPIFSVMGSTVKMDDSFRKIRPGGIALVPGFGAQGGEFANVMPLVMKDGPMAGHGGIYSSSRAHNFAWMKKNGGSGDPKSWREDLQQGIAKFRKDEKQAYAEAGLPYPF